MPKKLSIFSTNTWGDRFYQPLQIGHQNVLVPAAPANFSILACNMVGTFYTFWPLGWGKGRGGGGQGLHLGTPCGHNACKHGLNVG